MSTNVARVEQTSFSAHASANVLRLTNSDAGPHATALNGLRLGTANATVDAEESTASATQLTGPPGAPPTSATRRAGGGDNDEESGTATRSNSGVELPFLTLGASRLTATANWADPDGPIALSSALARPGELVLRPEDDEALMHVWRGSQTRTQTQLVAVAGQSTLGLRTTAKAELSAVTLFRGTSTEVTIRFLRAPSLMAVAAGSERTDVRYVPPIVAVTASQGRSYRLDAAGESIEVPLDGPGCCNRLVRVRLGTVRERVGHTSVDATAAAVRLQIVGAEDRLLDATIGDLDVSAHVPVGGLGHQKADHPRADHPRADHQKADPCEPCANDEIALTPSENVASPPAESASPQPVTPTSAVPAAAETLPRTGASLPLIAALGLALLTIGWIVIRAVRRRA
ncbi:LPXTG cell wall anchor domain-containing protein [Cryptosporangium japonicum]|uniref:Gram-positive cocci surface proteins LPxTG domain-containing protein n=1 Tax=Cryptosporangium japonicum TaxID=80872 RepID=A0ABP3EKN5_9ACTN